MKLRRRGKVLFLPDEGEKLTAEETKKLYNMLKKQGIPEKTAQKIVELYEEG